MTGSPYSDAEEWSQLRLCLHNAINNASPRTGNKMDRPKLYRKCLLRRVKEKEIKELEKCECVSYVMTIAPVLNIEGEKNGYPGNTHEN